MFDREIDFMCRAIPKLVLAQLNLEDICIDIF